MEGDDDEFNQDINKARDWGERTQKKEENGSPILVSFNRLTLCGILNSSQRYG